MPYFNLDDAVQLYYEEEGQGQPIIFIHGVWMSGRFFHKQLPYFGQNYHAIALDMRGHGRSAHFHSGHTMNTYAQDVHAFIKGKGLTDVVLVGWSMGGLVMLDYFRQFGAENIKAGVLIDQGASDFKWPDWESGLFDLPTLAYIMSAVQTDRTTMVKGMIPTMFKEAPPESEVKWMLAEYLRVPESIASAVFFDQSLQDYRQELSDITVPVLIIFGGDENKAVPNSAGEHLQQNIPNARLVIFEDSSHCPFLEETDRFNQEVDQFIQSLG